MSNIDYIDEEIEKIITKQIFEKYFYLLKIEGKDYFLNKMTIELFRLKIRSIKYFKGSVVLNDFIGFKLDIRQMKKENVLSKKEIKYFQNFLKILNDKNYIPSEECYRFMTLKLRDWFFYEQKNIYKKIIMLEEKNKINEILKNF